MDSTASPSPMPPQAVATTVSGCDVVSGQKVKDAAAPAPAAAYLSMVDPFLVEALQNPRHRLTILRMELDIQKFLQNPDQHHFEFQHFPTSYLRLAAHRVAQHYGLQTMVQDNVIDGQGHRIVVRKSAGTKYPVVRLSDVPPKQSENEKSEQIKIVIRPRPSRTSSNDGGELGLKRSPLRTMEERKEDYDRARARIFSGPSSPESEERINRVDSDVKDICFSVVENEGPKNASIDLDRNINGRESGSSSRVAIFRDREKDRTDPDYDRSYDRYVRNIPTGQSFNLAPFSVQKFQVPYIQYDSVFPPVNQMPRTQASLGYRSPAMSPFCAAGLNQRSTDPVYMQWPSQSMMYAQSYDQLRQAFFQAPFCQQPLSFDYCQNHL